ncbi:MAG TPA: hypothetical protein PLC67_03520 [Spirochaetota bacterium]|nr:hypothetical protein [Spirochaetota bacterium]
MNQSQVKELLLRLEGDVEDFMVTFTGKKSNKVDGLYYAERREILIHNTNVQSENEIIYTAIHEFAHHIQFTKSAQPVTARSHSTSFWNIFHKLLFKAEDMNIYKNPFKTHPDFVKLTERIKNDYLRESGEKMKEFGACLIEAMRLCEMHKTSFEDYVDRELGLHRFAAKTMMKSYAYNVNPAIGAENMRSVARIADGDLRKDVENAYLSRMSPDMVKAEFSPRLAETKDMTRLQFLKNEKERLIESLERLNQKLVGLNSQIRSLETEIKSKEERIARAEKEEEQEEEINE